MRTVRRVAVPAIVLCVLAVFIGCQSTPTEPPKLEAINNSDVYKLAQDALQPIVDQFVERGDRILLANMPAFYGAEAWRFVPTPLEVKQEDYEGIILPGARKLFKPRETDPNGGVPEVKILNDLFTLDSGKKVYKLKTSGDKYDELLLGRTLAGAGYSGLGPFSLADFVKANPYFIDSFESGLLGAVLKKQGKGFERLVTPAMAMKDIPAESQKNLKDLLAGRLVFGTDMINFNTWNDVQKTYDPNKISKLLMYSINNVVATGMMEYVGIQVTFRLIDIARGGKILWSGTKSLVSDKFPKDKVPSLGTLRLTIPPQAVSAQKDAFVRTLRDQGVRSMTAVLMKIDDIPIFGSYPITREDFAVENALEGFFASFQLSGTQGVTIVDKLFPRQYKQPWQLAHAVHYINPVLGGDYTQFKNYYSAQYMIGYRVLWKKIQGVQLLQGDKDLELSGKIIGIYIKIMDMADNGRVVLSNFLTLGTDAELDQSVLYRCFERTRAFTGLAEALRSSGVVTDSTHTALINRRMEIANNYISDITAGQTAGNEKPAAENFILNRLPPGDDQRALMMSYFDAYEILRNFGQPFGTVPETFWSKVARFFSGKKKPEGTLTPSQELNLTIAINLMQTWFEDGLCTALVTGDAAPNEKMESLYSRYLILKSIRLANPKAANTDEDTEEMLYLSPLLISKWISMASTPPLAPVASAAAPAGGAAATAAPAAPVVPAPQITTLKSYYGVDKIIYFSLLETGVPSSTYIKPPSKSPIARYFPLVASDPDSLQVSVVNVNSGDYEFKQDFPLK